NIIVVYFGLYFNIFALFKIVIMTQIMFLSLRMLYLCASSNDDSFLALSCLLLDLALFSIAFQLMNDV
ncbi:MAG: hypothetical protein ACTHLL_02940, partial [Candidatus Nitrosocosmicus sp.]